LGDSKFRDSIAATGAWFIFGLFLNSIQGSGWELQGFALSTLTTLFSVLFMERHAILSRRQLLHLHLLHLYLGLYFRIQFGKSRHRAPLTSRWSALMAFAFSQAWAQYDWILSPGHSPADQSRSKWVTIMGKRRTGIMAVQLLYTNWG